LNGLGCGGNPRIGGEDAGLPLGFGGGDTGLSVGLASGVAQYPQNTMPSALSLPHCLHAGIRSPWAALPNLPVTSEKMKK
jgi:hypothetical protein